MAETVEQKSVLKKSERVVKGVWGSGGGAVALGRVYPPEAVSSEACILCLLDRSDVETAERRSSFFSPSGVILAASIISPELLNFLIASRLPYLIIKEELSHEIMGRVALLDAGRDILIVDPDIDTLNRYAAANRISQESALELASECGENRVGFTLKNDARGGVLVRADRTVSSAELFDALLDIAEECCGAPVSFGLDLSHIRSCNESFCERAEALFRAAVYGNFSIQLEGYRGELDLSCAYSLLHRVFCSLEQEGREFNGYLPRGILVSSPVWLMQPIPLGKADFICFDFDRLSARLLGCELDDLAREELPKEELLAAWKCYFSCFAPSCELRAESDRLASSPLFKEWRALSGVERVYN